MKIASALLPIIVLGTVGCTSPTPNNQEEPNPTPSDAGRLEIKNTGDPDADFLRAMISHDLGAIDMARQELAAGTDPTVRQWAKDSIAAQQAEIRQMKAWLKKRETASAKEKK